MALPLPSTLTPSKLSRFVTCPLSFRYSYIDHLPEPPTTAQVRGTLVHRALQRLFAAPAAERTIERAHHDLERAWNEVARSHEAEALALGEKDTAAFVAEGHRLIERYFALEDPSAVDPVGTELDLRAQLGTLEVRGIVDRLDREGEDRFVLIDYKTGRSPRVDRTRERLGGVLFYAYLCEAVLGIRPAEVRLVYLGDQVVVVEEPSDQSMRGLRMRALAVWDAIPRACEREDFRPRPSSLCRFCAFQDRCPAFAAPSTTEPAEPEVDVVPLGSLPLEVPA